MGDLFLRDMTDHWARDLKMSELEHLSPGFGPLARSKYQDECFTPQKKLQRSPPSQVLLTGGDKENHMIGSKESVQTKRKTTPLSPSELQNISRY